MVATATKKDVKMNIEYIETLSKIELFNGIEKEDLDMMLKCLRPKLCTYKKNELITLEGNEFIGIGIIIKGEAIVIKENIDGKRFILSKLKKEDIFGEIAVFSNNLVWPATIEAEELPLICSIKNSPTEPFL